MSVYRVIDVIGTSETSWGDAAVSAIKTAETSVRGARVAEVVEQDIHITDGDQIVFRTKVRLSFKYEEHHHWSCSRCSGSSSQRGSSKLAGLGWSARRADARAA